MIEYRAAVHPHPHRGAQSLERGLVPIRPGLAVGVERAERDLDLEFAVVVARDRIAHRTADTPFIVADHKMPGVGEADKDHFARAGHAGRKQRFATSGPLRRQFDPDQTGTVGRRFRPAQQARRLEPRAIEIYFGAARRNRVVADKDFGRLRRMKRPRRIDQRTAVETDPEMFAPGQSVRFAGVQRRHVDFDLLILARIVVNIGSFDQGPAPAVMPEPHAVRADIENVNEIARAHASGGKERLGERCGKRREPEFQPQRPRAEFGGNQLPLGQAAAPGRGDSPAKNQVCRRSGIAAQLQILRLILVHGRSKPQQAPTIQADIHPPLHRRDFGFPPTRVDRVRQRWIERTEIDAQAPRLPRLDQERFAQGSARPGVKKTQLCAFGPEIAHVDQIAAATRYDQRFGHSRRPGRKRHFGLDGAVFHARKTLHQIRNVVHQPRQPRHLRPTRSHRQSMDHRVNPGVKQQEHRASPQNPTQKTPPKFRHPKHRDRQARRQHHHRQKIQDIAVENVEIEQQRSEIGQSRE